VTRSIDVRAGGETKLNVRLPARQEESAILDIYSAPTGASVTVNGAPKGRTPVVGLSAKAGRSQAVVVNLDGYRTWSTNIAPSPGKNPAIIATLQAERASAAPVATAAVRDISVPRSIVGDPERGKAVFRSGCNTCHGKSARKLRPQRYTRRQWHAYFASQRHTSKSPWKDNFSRAELAAVKGYMLTRAADVESATAAGVR
jgi:mono/diheme cytochrome c family protein